MVHSNRRQPSRLVARETVREATAPLQTILPDEECHRKQAEVFAPLAGYRRFGRGAGSVPAARSCRNSFPSQRPLRPRLHQSTSSAPGVN